MYIYFKFALCFVLHQHKAFVLFFFIAFSNICVWFQLNLYVGQKAFQSLCFLCYYTAGGVAYIDNK